MSEEEFKTLTLPAKWNHLKMTMDYIMQMDSLYGPTGLRVRMNPHHPEKDKKQEQYNLRIDQYQRWSHVKALYCAHRDELADTLGNESYAACKNIMERIFTMEVDDALRDILDEDSRD